MPTELQFEVIADQVDMEDLWRAITKDKIEVTRKFAPGLLGEAGIIEGKELGLGSVVYVHFGPVMPGVEPFKEKVVELDESRHLVRFLGLEGGYMKLGFTHYVVSFKLDDAGGGKILFTTTFTYDLEQNIDGARLLDGFVKGLHQYVNGVIRYLQERKA